MQVDVSEGSSGVSQAAVDFVIGLAIKADVAIRRMNSDDYRLNVHLEGFSVAGGIDWSGGASFPLDLLESAVNTPNQAKLLYIEYEFLNHIAKMKEGKQ